MRVGFIYTWKHLYLHIYSALYQIQNRKLRLIVYANKQLPEADGSYLITELELCGLAD